MDNRKEQSGHGYGQAVIDLSGGVAALLTLLFVHVEIGESDQRAKQIQSAACQDDSFASVLTVNKNCGERPEADQIAEGIDLDSEAFFLLSTSMAFKLSTANARPEY